MQGPCFIDGQNLYKSADRAFGLTHPDYDVMALANELVAVAPDRVLKRVSFYTGIHNRAKNQFWWRFWTNKTNAMRRAGVDVITRPLRYDGSGHGREKGIYVRLALDVVRHARATAFDVAIIVSQDQDLNEAVADLKRISRELDFWLAPECAFPVGPGTQNRRGINGANWIRIDAPMYGRCIDPTDYR